MPPDQHQEKEFRVEVGIELGKAAAPLLRLPVSCMAAATLILAGAAGCAPAATHASNAPAAVPPKAAGTGAEGELKEFIDSTSSVRIARTADLDGDGDLDVIAIIERPNAGSSGAPRTLLLLKRGVDGRLGRVAENPNAILAESRGGTMGDPLRDLAAHTGGFTLSFEGGSRELWSHEYEFEYTPSRNTWVLTQFKDKVLDRLDGKSDQRTLKASDFGEVTVAEFAPDALITD